jgi:hypothetical protein
VPRIIWIILVIVGILLLGIVAACAGVIISSRSSGVEESAPQPEVVVLLCSGNLEVVASDRSTNAPTVTATSCAQALSDLLNAGFEIQDVQPAIGRDGTQYTLIQSSFGGWQAFPSGE